MRSHQISVKHQLIIFFLITSVFSGITYTHAQVKELNPVGGAGGGYFKDEIDVKDIIIHAGDWIDGIQIIGKNGVRKPLRGGNGGSPHTFSLQQGEYITRISGTATGGFGQYVSQIQIHTNKRSSPVYGRIRGNISLNFYIPNGSNFAGFSGRCGGFLDALGVLYKAKVSVKLAPSLISPNNNAVLDNGCDNIANELSWYFQWTLISGASRYQLYVKNKNSQNPLINLYVNSSSYNYKVNSHIASQLTLGWDWWVRAEFNGVWGKWSSVRTFSVEALNTDCQVNEAPQITIKEPAIFARGFVVVEAEKSRVSGQAIDNDGIASVKVNGVYAQVDGSGNFNATIPVKIGDNTVTVVATDKKMKSTTKTFKIVRNLPDLKPAKRLALVIGNANYVFGGSLSNPVNDANSINSALKALGFTVIKLTNCDQRTLKKGIDDFGEKLKNYDVGLFFYAGHGIQVNGNNYLIPTNAQLRNEKDVEYDCVNASRVLAKMESAGTKTNIVIMDACRDNPFERSWSRGLKGKGLAFMNAPSGSLIAYATSPGNTASDGDGNNGLYTSALLQHLNTPNITIEEVFKLVRQTVIQKSGGKQTPWESTSLLGKFYLKK